ncbi:NACHT, LRR and PYD domains-containing protein 3-like isoform X1 [Pygocentrus nattereri]|uniref:NACHT domain-containing protein n=1 Tax=Pygocentrus nattereri TaxID=42514 RepID=A0AAR2LB03_PYGNA|nr:NACHT, LRR and PYD domains-containing protein 3-like isoform X1 [Pygocentrus nattereri]
MEVQTPDHGAPVQTNITAQTGGTACAPVFDGSTIQSLTVINNIYGAQKSSTPSNSTGQDGDTPGDQAITEENLTVYKQKHKDQLRNKLKTISEGISKQGISTLLNEIYTELYITEGGSGEVNNEHEVRQIETSPRRRTTQETAIKCNDIFKPLLGQDKHIRTVLTRGIAGIGKTVSVQKFILDWAEGEANQDIAFIFPLPFRELNLMKGKKLSLMELLHCFFRQTKDFQSIESDDYKVLLVFDGLDECRLPLDFENNESLFDVTDKDSVDVLLTNLIKGNLFPSALLWITSRPAAANQIPSECVDQVTEVRGFSDPQKEEYFRKRIRNQNIAEKIIEHMKSSRSLYIMCHIPVFCWISATVLERMLSEAVIEKIPKTVTQMFTKFLIFQIKHKSQKYQGKCDIDTHMTKESILGLGKLAFQQLEEGNLIFYEDDLKECGIDVKEVSVYSGVCTQIFREEFGLELGKAFSFVHLSVQEFLAALFAFLCFVLNNTNVLMQTTGFFSAFKKSKMSDVLKCAVDKALQSDNGHLDLFLRFILGLSLESNHTLLRGILPLTGSITYSKEEIVEYIKKKIRENPSPESTINLFHCLNELNDHSLMKEVQTFLNRGGGNSLHASKLSPAQWSAVAYVLLNSEEELDEFDLSKYDPSEECLLRLLPVVKASQKVVTRGCNLTEKSCAVLATAFSSNSSCLRELDLSDNELQDSGVMELCAGLENHNCKLEKLVLHKCSITNKGYAAILSALKSNPSHLRELNLNNNDPGETAVKLLSNQLEDPHCKLEKLQLSHCNITKDGCAALLKALKLNPSSHLRELNLSYNQPGDSGLKELCAVDCKLKKLQLCCCNLTDRACVVLASFMSSESSCLIELILNENNLQNSGAELLSSGLENPHCRLETLGLFNCSITEDGCIALVKALKSNHSHLRELNLSGNKPGDSAVKELSDRMKDPHCKLEKLQLCDCSLTEESCAALASVLSSESSHLKELNLSYNKVQDSGVKLLSPGLEKPHCKLETLRLCKCSIKDEGCAALVEALKSNPSSQLTELNLSFNFPGDAELKELSDLLKDPLSKLDKIHTGT